MSIEEIKNKINPILKKNGVEKAAIFGSYARGDQTKKSDIDILIKYKYDDKSYFDLVGLQFELEKKLKKKVDLLTYSGVHKRLRKEIFGSKKEIL
ncbi:MAG: nucleotidyltransferase domain-containing protein [Patescibacteria group bacterium]